MTEIEKQTPEARDIQTEGGNYSERIEGHYIQAEQVYITEQRSCKTTNDSPVKGDLFLAGCIVGKRLALVPSPESNNLVILDEFLQAVEIEKRGENQILLPA